MAGDALVLIPPDEAQRPSTGKDTKENDIAVAWCLQTIDDQGVRIFADQLGNLQVIVPMDHDPRPHPLNSSRLEAFLHAEWYSTHQRVLPQGAYAYVKKVVEHQAWSNPGLLPYENRAWSLVEEDPTGLALIAYLNTNGQYAGRTVNLYRTLRSPDYRRQISWREARFPCNTQVFSRRLKSLIPIMKTIGVDIVLDHKDDGSHCTIQIADARLFYREPDGNLVSASEPSSATTAGKRRTVRRPDESDAILGPRELEDLPEDELSKLRNRITPIEEESND